MGGDTGAAGNLIERGAGLTERFPEYGVSMNTQEAPAQDLIANNTIRGFDIGVYVYIGSGADITQNHMSDDGLGIKLGEGPFFYNPLYSSYSGKAANHLQEYPLLQSVSEQHGTTEATISLEVPPGAPEGAYAIELYSQPSCEQDSITPGLGAQSLGIKSVKVETVSTVKLSFDAASGAVTATATAPDGSTSEFSPCLTIGDRAATFVGDGVTLPDKTVTTTSSTASAARASAKRKPGAEHKPSAKHKPGATGKHVTTVATLRPFCPPVTKRYCEGVAVLAASAHGKALARFTFKLAPGELGTVKVRLPAALAERLARAHRLKLTLTIRARDGAKHPHRKRTVERVTLV